MQFLYLLESIRNPFLDFLMSSITRLGEETLFIVIALIFFWCINKYEGYYLMLIGFAGTVINQFLKITFRIPRPWVLDKKFSVVSSAIPEATGYSFPSGHTQSAVGTWGGISLYSKNKPLRIMALLIIILVPLSRMYLGVHTPLDVSVSFAVAILLSLILLPLIKKGEEKPQYMYILMGVLIVFSLAFLLYCECYSFPKAIDAENYSSALENSYKLFGCALSMPIVYFCERRFIRFKTDGSLSFQIFKVLCGLILVLGVQKGTKPLFNMLFGGHPAANSLRYFLVVIVAGIAWPMIFSAIKRKREEKNEAK